MDEGWTIERVREFFARPEIREYHQTVQREYAHAPVIEARIRYNLVRELAVLGDRAVEVLEQALRGPLYMRGPNNEVLLDNDGEPLLADAAPDRDRIEAAKEVLSRLGVGPKIVYIEGDLDRLFERIEDADDVPEVDPSLETEAEQVISRERVRTAMERLLPELPTIRRRMAEALTPPPKRRGGRKPRKKGA